ncbi:hypothetical protein J2Y48_004549 [Mycoplana sp. BE70]|uniref:hypothetical protein n=1 Tax=Mycoplana sp. BE70 TaxID=2817775 RepID=UPI00285F9477|nr:hypothetical protein [Mycoplana sp. BE70]MDR6759233.1 hypothetical protein [Mycoplana sp. BE70]
MQPKNIDHIARTLAELIKLAEEETKESSRSAMLVYLLSLAMAEADDLKRASPGRCL